VRYTAPDVLRARIRGALADEVARDPAPAGRPASWPKLLAAALLIAAASSTITVAAMRHESGTTQTTNAVVASHVRSLIPGHLVDVASTNTHNVKPWFNGRIDLSPLVPNLDSLGFPLLGGRVDYIGTRQAAVVVYGRRQHVINVYSWAAPDHRLRAPERSSEKGFHVVHWAADGIESWAVSDLNAQELDQFVALLTASR
jgi:anti-sigma factor RsiW